MKISKRLQAIADCVSVDSKVIDVGCDHALLDIYLSMYKNCICIASDINENALDQAKYNIARFGAKNIKLVLTDGLNGIEVNKNDILVISGMGTTTINYILEEANLPNTLIISSHNDHEDLRKIITNLQYQIVDEKFVEEKGKEYIIIVFKKGTFNYDETDYIYGPILKNNKYYLQKLYDKTKKVYDQIPEDSSEKIIKEKRLYEIKSLIKE